MLQTQETQDKDQNDLFKNNNEKQQIKIENNDNDNSNLNINNNNKYIKYTEIGVQEVQSENEEEDDNEQEYQFQRKHLNQKKNFIKIDYQYQKQQKQDQLPQIQTYQQSQKNNFQDTLQHLNFSLESQRLNEKSENFVGSTQNINSLSHIQSQNFGQFNQSQSKIQEQILFLNKNESQQYLDFTKYLQFNDINNQQQYDNYYQFYIENQENIQEQDQKNEIVGYQQALEKEQKKKPKRNYMILHQGDSMSWQQLLINHKTESVLKKELKFTKVNKLKSQIEKDIDTIHHVKIFSKNNNQEINKCGKKISKDKENNKVTNNVQQLEKFSSLEGSKSQNSMIQDQQSVDVSPYSQKKYLLNLEFQYKMKQMEKKQQLKENEYQDNQINDNYNDDYIKQEDIQKGTTYMNKNEELLDINQIQDKILNDNQNQYFIENQQQRKQYLKKFLVPYQKGSKMQDNQNQLQQFQDDFISQNMLIQDFQENQIDNQSKNNLRNKKQNSQLYDQIMSPNLSPSNLSQRNKEFSSRQSKHQYTKNKQEDDEMPFFRRQRNTYLSKTLVDRKFNSQASMNYNQNNKIQDQKFDQHQQREEYKRLRGRRSSNIRQNRKINTLNGNFYNFSYFSGRTVSYSNYNSNENSLSSSKNRITYKQNYRQKIEETNLMLNSFEQRKKNVLSKEFREKVQRKKQDLKILYLVLDIWHDFPKTALERKAKRKLLRKKQAKEQLEEIKQARKYKVDFMWLKESLLKFLRFLKKINLSINEYVQFRQQFHKQELVSSKAYQREGSFVFFKNVKMGHIKQVEQALKLNKLFNLDHNQYGKTALHEAVIKENYDMVHLILSYGCDYDVRDKVGKTPLFYALKFQNWKIACLLLSKLCDPWSLPGTDYIEFCDQEMKQRLKIYRKINLMLQLIHSEVKKEYYIKKLKENMPDVDIWI